MPGKNNNNNKKEQVETATGFLFSWLPNSPGTMTIAMKLKNKQTNKQNLLFFERKAMKNLDYVLKSRDITLPTKVHMVKAIQ